MNNSTRLKNWREAAGLTLSAAAKLVGATHPAWLSWETGQKRPSYPLARALDRLAGGAVPENEWLSETERTSIDAVQPYIAAVA